MKKWLIFIGGVLTGVVLTILFISFFIVKALKTNQIENKTGTTFFEQPGDILNVNSLKVFQVISQDAALTHGKPLINKYNDPDLDYLSGPIYLLINDDGKYYYDDEIINVPENKVARQVGVYQYQTQSEFEKTVPIIKIMDK